MHAVYTHAREHKGLSEKHLSLQWTVCLSGRAMSVLSHVGTKAAVVFYALQMSLLIATLLQLTAVQTQAFRSCDCHCLLLLFCETQTKDVALEEVNC